MKALFLLMALAIFYSLWYAFGELENINKKLDKMKAAEGVTYYIPAYDS